MQSVRLAAPNDFDEWRGRARQLLAARRAPAEVAWQEPAEADGLFGDGADEPPAAAAEALEVRVPRRFIELAEAAICHRDPQRFDLLYRLLWRLQEQRSLLDIRSDPDVRRLEQLAGAVRRDAHKMKAFVRFRAVVGEDGSERFAAWFEPEHHIVERVAPFFARRFAGMVWAIVTPARSVWWDGTALAFGPGGSRADVPAEDALEDSWRTYFASIFNPARLKVRMMKSEMPVKYWRNLPEAELIEPLIRQASQRTSEMIERPATRPPVRHQRQGVRAAGQAEGADEEIVSLAAARAAIAGCRRCPLFEFATQAVFGEGPASAEVMFVGEQPGDQEDLTGRPFVGPAGQVFDAALEKVGIERARTYVTNAVKHFKFVPRGKRRLHQSPNGGEIAACRFWLDLERSFVRPRLLVALGATALHSVLGRAATISSLRGQTIELEEGTRLIVTVHPSYLLRLRDPDDRRREAGAFEADLRRVRELMQADGRA